MEEQARIQKCWDRMIDETCDGNKSEFARLLKMSPQSFQNYYNGNRKPGWEILKRIAALGFSLNWLILDIKPHRLNDLVQVDADKKSADTEDVVKDYFKQIDQENLSDAEHQLLAEVKFFSNFLETRDLNPYVKRLLLEQLIDSIDQAE